MKRNIRLIKTIFSIFFICFFTTASFTIVSLARDPIYNAKVNIRIKWSDGILDEPVIPRAQIVTLNVTVILEIKTGESFGAGLLEGYTGSVALIDLYIVEFPSWCYATLKSDLLMTNISELAEANTQIYININENAPAYAQGYIKFRVKVDNLGLIKGDDQIFSLPFRPAFFPLIKTEFPVINSMEINPNSKAVFPITIENAGNAKTKVFFELENVPEGWSATIRDSIILGDSAGSKETVYLTVISPNNFGYHYEVAMINVKITPAFAEDIQQKGDVVYANFIIRNRGFASGGSEYYFVIIIIIMTFIFIFLKYFKRKTLKDK